MWVPIFEEKKHAKQRYILGTIYHEISNISHTESQNFNDSRLVFQLSLPSYIEAGCLVEIEHAAAPTGNASTTSEWSTN